MGVPIRGRKRSAQVAVRGGAARWRRGGREVFASTGVVSLTRHQRVRKEIMSNNNLALCFRREVTGSHVTLEVLPFGGNKIRSSVSLGQLKGDAKRDATGPDEAVALTVAAP